MQQFGTSKNEHERAAATYILGYISDSDSCLDCIKESLDPFTNFLIDRMQDDSLIVREAAGETVGRFCENLTGDFIGLHKKIMPCLIRVAQDLAESKHDMT